jgi:hypothetical protein
VGAKSIECTYSNPELCVKNLLRADSKSTPRVRLGRSH